MKLKNSHILAFIIIVAAILRTYDLFNIPYTHDEFSALFRLEFDNFKDLIAYGVKIDGHPAGIHVFLYYWTSLFGTAEWVVKLPFIFFGISSIWFIFKIGKIWQNETVGLIAASFMTVSQFTVMYSQIARPYISGLFFSLVMVYFWSKLMLQPNKRFYTECDNKCRLKNPLNRLRHNTPRVFHCDIKQLYWYYRNFIGFILGSSLCTYNHHFSMLFAVIVGLSGLFLINKKFLLRYILSGLIVFILYIPHLEILFYQMGIGGVEGWLAKPSDDFFWRFIQFMFNYSWWFLSLAFILIVYGFFNGKAKINARTYILFAIFFLLPFVIGFFYSKNVNSVLQFSVLIFSAPYLYFLLFGHVGLQKFGKNVVIVLSILTFGIISLVVDRQYYTLFYENYYEHSLIDLQGLPQAVTNVPAVVNARKDIVNYYAERQSNDNTFLWYDGFKSKSEFAEYLEKTSKSEDYFYLSLDSASDPTIVPLVQLYFPAVVALNNYRNGTTYLFSKNSKLSLIDHRKLFSEMHFDGQSKKGWLAPPEGSISQQKFWVDNDLEWGPGFEMDIDKIVESEKDFIDVEVSFEAQSTLKEATLVIELIHNDDRNSWAGIPLSSLNGLSKTVGSLKLSDITLSKDAQLKAYIWNKGKEAFVINDIKIYARRGNPIIYGLFYPI